MPSALYHLAYQSTAGPDFDAAGMLRVLNHARAANSAHHITGLLLVRERQILQFLEGPEAPVKSVYAAIALDPRHFAVTLQHEGPLASREFPDWAMALAGDPAPTGLIPPGLVDASRQAYLQVRQANLSEVTTKLLAHFLGPALWLP